MYCSLPQATIEIVLVTARSYVSGNIYNASGRLAIVRLFKNSCIITDVVSLYVSYRFFSLRYINF